MKQSVIDYNYYLSDFLNSIKQVYIPAKEELIFKEILIYNQLFNDDNIVVSHQPNLFYPGTFIKFVYLFKTNFKNKLIIFNDSDKFFINILNKTWELDIPYETLSLKYIKEFLNYYCNFLKEINFKFGIYFRKADFKDNILYFINLFSSIDLKDIFSFSDFIYFVINKYFEFFNKGFEIKFKTVSEISKTDEFKRFFVNYVLNYRDLNILYNEAVDILYSNNIKTVRKIELYELPFWFISNKGFRNTLYIEDNDIFYLEGNQRVYIDIKDDKIMDLIRPKAVVWAAFRRIYFSNIDILGIGSSYYTFVSDYLLFNYYLKYIKSLKLKKTDIITTTLYPFDYNLIADLGLLLDNILSVINGILSSLEYNIENLSKVFQKLNNLFENVPKFLISEFNDLFSKTKFYIDLISSKIIGKNGKELISYKKELIRKISDPDNRKIKRELTKELEKVNKSIKDLLRGDINSLRELVLELNKKVLFIKGNVLDLSTRYWPFFIFGLDDYLNVIKETILF
jgi:hypothetical protein